MATPTINVKFNVIPCKDKSCVLKFNSNRTLTTEYKTNFLLTDNLIGVDKNMKELNDVKEYEKRGNPFKRGKTWTFIYYVADPLTGKKKQKYQGGYTTKKDAENALSEMNAKILTGRYVEDKYFTLEQYINQWYDEVCLPRLAQNTLNGYKTNIFNHIIPYLGNKKITELTRADVRKFYNMLGGKFSPKTIQYVHRVLSKALKEAVIEGLILKNPCDNVERPSVKKYKALVYNTTQVKILMEVIKNTEYELPILFAVALGLRRGEALGLRYSDIDFNANTAHIQQQVTKVVNPIDKNKSVWGIKELKTEGSNRVVSIPPFLVNLIKQQQAKAIDNKLLYGVSYKDYDLICCIEDGDFIHPEKVDKHFKILAKKAELPNIRFHDLRHSFATNLLELDIPLKVISNSLGHSSISITADIYCDVLEKKKQVADVMQLALFGV